MIDYALEQLKILAGPLGIDRPDIAKCLEKAARNPDSIPAYKNHFLKLLKREGFPLHDLPLFSLNHPTDAPEEGIFVGNIVFGNGRTRKLFIPLESFQRHSLVVGMTGTGKSTLVKSLIPQFIKMGIGVWIFDHENEYKSLIRNVEPDKMLVLDHETDKDNLLEPADLVARERWRSVLLAVLREQWLRDGSLNLLGDVLSQVCSREGRKPNVLDVFMQLKAMQFKPGTRYSGYHESAINRIAGLLDDMGKVLLCERGYRLADLMDKCVVFNISAMSDVRRHFYVTLKMLRVMTFLEKLPPKGLRILFIIDEAHRFYNKEIARKRSDMGEPLMFANARTFAKRGIGCFYLDQIPSELPPAPRGNVNNIFCARLTNGECIRWAEKAMNLTPQRAQKIPLIEDRHFLFLSGEFPNVLLLEVPEIRFGYVTDEEAHIHTEKLISGLEYVPAPEESEDLKEEALSVTSKASSARPNKLWAEIAKLVAEIGWISLSDLGAHLGNLAPWHVRRNLAAMVKQDLIELCPISFGTRGNPRTYVILCPKGAEFIGLKHDDVRLQGKGSTEHVILQNILAEAMKNAGKTVVIEHSANGKSVDIAEISPDRTIAYELELAPAHEHVAENAIKDIEAGFDKVVVITKNQAGQNEAKERIYKTIGWEKLPKIEFKLLREFL
jgi:hypothetical protein